jgi:hypothetical protein
MKRIAFLSIIIACSLLFSACNHATFSSYTVFSDIKECEALKNSNLEGACFEEYDISEKDRYLKELAYTACFAGRFSCDEFDFEIYAYEFADVDTAKQYFENATGKQQESDHKRNFSLVQGIGIPLFNTSFTVYEGKNAYRIYTDNWKDWKHIKALLDEIFTVQVSLSDNDDNGLER